MREKKKNVERENVEFRQRGYRNSSVQFYCLGMRGVRGVPKVKRKKKKFDKLIVAMPLPKQGGKNCNNCGNGIAENGGKKMWFRNLERVKKKCYVHNIFTINHM